MAVVKLPKVARKTNQMIELNGFSLKTIHIPTKINPAYKSTSETTPQGKDGIIESNKDT